MVMTSGKGTKDVKPANGTPSGKSNSASKKEQARGMDFEQGARLFEPPLPEPMKRSSIPEPERPKPSQREFIHSIPAYHVILEQLAHKFAYHSPDLSTGLEDVPQAERAERERAMLKAIGFEKRDVIANGATGFQATLFLPIIEMRGGKKDPTKVGLPPGVELRPVVAFRGTASVAGAVDDANPKGVGAFQWKAHAHQVKGMLGVAAAYGLGPADVTGHSLGGALAQRCAAEHGALVNDVITFQSPGIGDDAHKVDEKKHGSTHYVMEGDIVSQAGGRRTPGMVVELNELDDGLSSHTKFPLAAANADRRGKEKVSGVEADPQLTKALNPEIKRTHTSKADLDPSRVAMEKRRMNPGGTVGGWTQSSTLGRLTDAGLNAVSRDQQNAMVLTSRLEAMAFTSAKAGRPRTEFERDAFNLLLEHKLLGPNSNVELGQHLLQQALMRFDEGKGHRHGVDPKAVNRPIERPLQNSAIRPSGAVIEPRG